MAKTTHTCPECGKVWECDAPQKWHKVLEKCGKEDIKSHHKCVMHYDAIIDIYYPGMEYDDWNEV